MVKGQPLRFIRHHHGRKTIAPACGYIIDEKTGCWIWMLLINERGYGRGQLDGRKGYAHILQYEKRYGPVPAGMELDHMCRNRRCCNPDHLEPVSHAENVRRGSQTKLTADDARAILASGEHPKALARRYGISVPVIYGIRARTIWRGIERGQFDSEMIPGGFK